MHSATQPPKRWLWRLLWHFRKLDPVAQMGFFAAVLTMVFAAIAVMPVIVPAPVKPLASVEKASVTGTPAADAKPAAVAEPESQSNIELRTKLASAVATFMSGDAPGAEKTVRWVIEQSEARSGSPKIEAEARRWLARMIRHREPQTAMDEIRLATRIDPGNREAWLDRSELASDMGSVDEAAHAYATSGELAGDQSTRAMTNQVAELLIQSQTRPGTAASKSTDAPQAPQSTLPGPDPREQYGRPI